MKFPFLNFFKLVSGVITTSRGLAVGALTAANGVFSGAISATTGTFTGPVSAAGSDLATQIIASMPAHYERASRPAIKGYSTAADRYTLTLPRFTVNINDVGYTHAASADYDLSAEATWDTVAGTDYRTASNRAGVDFYVYACTPASGTAPTIKISANSTTPSGYTAATSRKIGGFHGLCVAVGTIAGHTLTGFAQGDILPASVWDLKHRPVCEPEGMVYSETGFWADIYLTSGTGASTASANGGTISDTRTWLDFTDDYIAVGKRMPTGAEFTALSTGSNAETNIVGAADPVTTGGHSDTASRRMISNIGVEDCCGAMWQWLNEPTFRFDAAANHTHEVTVSGDPETVTSGNPSGDVAPAWSWHDLPGSRGSFYKQGTYGQAGVVLAGGYWAVGTNCGPGSRYAFNYRWRTASTIGGRGCARSR